MATQSTQSTEKPSTDTTLTDRVTAMLVAQIRGGSYPVNARLPTEKFMTEEYGVSRTVVREAISRLKSEGLVETRQGSGTVVLAPQRYETFRLADGGDDPALGVIHILELRCGIESEMAALAARRHTAAEMQQIKRAIKAMDRAVAAGGDGVQEDLAFHTAIARATSNPHYPALLGLLTRALEDAIRVTRGNEARVDELAAQVRDEHQAICVAIEARDPDAARAAAVRHMANTAGRIQAAERSYWSGPSGQVAQRLAKTDLGAVLDGSPRMTKMKKSKIAGR